MVKILFNAEGAHFEAGLKLFGLVNVGAKVFWDWKLTTFHAELRPFNLLGLAKICASTDMDDCKQGPLAKFGRDPYPSFTFDAGFDILKIFSGSILVNANKNVGFEANLKGKLLGVLEAEGDLKVSPEGLAVKLHVKAGGIVKMLTDAAKAGVRFLVKQVNKIDSAIAGMEDVFRAIGVFDHKEAASDGTKTSMPTSPTRMPTLSPTKYPTARKLLAPRRPVAIGAALVSSSSRSSLKKFTFGFLETDAQREEDLLGVYQRYGPGMKFQFSKMKMGMPKFNVRPTRPPSTGRHH